MNLSLIRNFCFGVALLLLPVSSSILRAQGSSSFQPINSLKLSPVESFSSPTKQKQATTDLATPVFQATTSNQETAGDQETTLPIKPPIEVIEAIPQEVSNNVNRSDPGQTTDPETIIENLPLPNTSNTRVTNQPIYLDEDVEIVSEIPEDQKDQRDLLLQAARNAVGLMDMELAIE
ncbi:MAG: hypothetical protein VX438_04170, partial [Planctomycetota bacterium]|nr:hypothetical protein [Planctomycetota bacterium]